MLSRGRFYPLAKRGISILKAGLLMGAVGCALLMGAAQAQIYGGDGEVIPGEGPKGRYSMDQVRPYALSQMRGELIDETTSWQNGDLFYEFVIEQADGSVFELEYFARNAQLYEVEVEKLGDRPRYPRGMVDHEAAKQAAHDYVRTRNSSAMRAKVEGLRIEAYQRRLVYIVRVKQMAREYDVMMDAFSGKILSMKKL